MREGEIKAPDSLYSRKRLCNHRENSLLHSGKTCLSDYTDEGEPNPKGDNNRAYMQN